MFRGALAGTVAGIGQSVAKVQWMVASLVTQAVSRCRCGAGGRLDALAKVLLGVREVACLAVGVLWVPGQGAV